MVLLVGQGREQAATQLRREFWPSHERPGKVLDRLELVMREPGQADLAMYAFFQHARSGQPVGPPVHAQPRIPRRALDQNGGPTRGIEQRPSVGTDRGGELRLEIAGFEEKLRHRYGTRVNIRTGTKQGQIEIEFYDNDDLERLLELLLGLDH